MSDHLTAWAAGLFEGEGCISLYRDPRKATRTPRVAVALSMTDRDIVERFAAWAACDPPIPIRERTSLPAGYKPQYRWQVARNADARRLIEAMLPYFGERRAAKAREALDSMRPHGLCLRRRHVLAEVGTYNGNRCRGCDRERRASYREADNARRREKRAAARHV